MKNERTRTTSGSAGPRHLVNDTVVNVAQLLQEQIGASRRFTLELDWFSLDTDMMARDVEATIQLLRVEEGIMAVGHVRGIAMLECVRCLELYEQPFESELEQLYRPMLDLHHDRVAGDDDSDDDAEVGEIDDLNQLDFAEPLRQFAILGLPMRPHCGEECPGPPVDLEETDTGDHRFAPLAALLEDQPDTGEE